MTDAAGAEVGFIAGYLHFVVALCFIGGVLLYALIEKKLDKPAKFGAYAAMQWGANSSSVPICVAYIAAVFNPDLWATLQRYDLFVAAYAVYHLAQMILVVIPKIPTLLKSEERPPKE